RRAAGRALQFSSAACQPQPLPSAPACSRGTGIAMTDPHAGQAVLHAGAPIAGARLAAICVHGRGASAEDILGLAAELGTTDVAYLAPQAAGATWYPYTFLSPIDRNEPYLSSALGVVGGLIRGL